MATAVTSTLKMPVLAALTLLLLAVACRASPYYPLELGYYRYKCPQAEVIVKAAMEKAIFQNPGNGAAVIRMLFHDCFVEGCGASVLLDPTPFSPTPEKLSPPNNPSLRGFELIDAIKHALEAACMPRSGLLRRHHRLRGPRRVLLPEPRQGLLRHAGGPPRRHLLQRLRAAQVPGPAVVQPQRPRLQLRRQGDVGGGPGRPLRRAHRRAVPLLVLRPRPPRRPLRHQPRPAGMVPQEPLPGQHDDQRRPDGDAGRGDAQRHGQPVLQERAVAHRALHLRRGAPDVAGDGQAGGGQRQHPRVVGGQVQEGHGQDGQHPSEDRVPGAGKEELQSDQPLLS
ncbi:hypothetical protein PVAP13_9NG558300 [Panicum virgatum]|uniref:Peroxidase n=1 Tax=Panicum virgatum TaxID=38727 RepID=A0A8T0MSS1_PANVG|nr:hypothetical protein PVAP13_9NG558300 [Panicum virgatum]